METTTSSPASQELTKVYYWDVYGARIHIEVNPAGETFVNGKLVHRVLNDSKKMSFDNNEL